MPSFFPDEALPCRNWTEHGHCNRHGCQFAHKTTSLSRFLTYLGKAQKTLDVCVFTITCDEISDTVIRLHNQGVKVRVITDDEQCKTQGSDIKRMAQAGIATKRDNAHTHMHHKFAIVDGKFLMTGSFNWTRQAVLGNQENVLVCDNAKLVRAYQGEFDKLFSREDFIVV